MAAATTASSRPRESQTKSSRRMDFMLWTSSRHRDGRRHAPADAAHVADGVGAELAPQRMNVHLDRIALDGLVPAVHLFFELSARQRGAGPREQRLEEGKLA